MLAYDKHVAAVEAGETGFPIVEIVWIDAVAFGTDSWSEDAETLPRTSTAVGYLVAETDETMSIASLVNTTHLGHGIVIPRTNIRSWRTVTHVTLTD